MRLDYGRTVIRIGSGHPLAWIAISNRRCVLTDIVVMVGMTVGLVAYTALMTFLALWAAEMRSQ